MALAYPLGLNRRGIKPNVQNMNFLAQIIGFLVPRTYAHIWDWEWRRHGLQAINSATASAAEFDESGRKDAEWLCYLVPKDAVALDFGCGIGRVAKYLAPQCRILYAADVSSAMLGKAHTYLAGQHNIVFTKISETRLPYRDGFFDTIFSLLVLQHMTREDAYLYLQEFQRTLKAGGKCIVQFPNLFSEVYWHGFLKQAGARRRSIARVRHYTISEVRGKMERARFRVESLYERGPEIIVVGSKE